MLLGGVEHVGHPRAAQVVQVAHRLAVTDDDPRADLGRHSNCIGSQYSETRLLRIDFNIGYLYLVTVHGSPLVVEAARLAPAGARV